ncbi:MAG: family 43 glycosylhydrolase [Prevotella sp.]|nr:family 43 glycosylhydrolase [Prevotella sp.]
MKYGDTSRLGRPYSKDPHVVRFGDRYLMYYSIPPHNWNKNEGWNIGIAESRDLIHWQKVGEINPQAEYEKRGLCAPCALVKDGEVHLFYQTYGNRRHDAICHAVSKDGITFVRDATNPIFRPDESAWSCGRAIDAEVTEFRGKYFLYFATRDPEFKIQKLGVAVADKDTDFSRSSWHLAADESILYPVLDWEGECIEGPSVYVKGKTMYMFYAGAYNNAPQQIGVAVSKDGVHFKRMSTLPFKPNGREGEWNSSESGHPHIFKDTDGKTYLFYQGNNDNGKTWLLTQEEVGWKKGKPYLKRAK